MGVDIFIKEGGPYSYSQTHLITCDLLRVAPEVKELFRNRSGNVPHSSNSFSRVLGSLDRILGDYKPREEDLSSTVVLLLPQRSARN